MDEKLAESLSFGVPTKICSRSHTYDMYEIPLITSSGSHGLRFLLTNKSGIGFSIETSKRIKIGPISPSELAFWSTLQVKMMDACEDAAKSLGIKRPNPKSVLVKNPNGETTIRCKFNREQIQFIDADTGMPFIGNIPRVKGDLLINIKSCIIFMGMAFMQVYFIGGIGKVLSSDGMRTLKGQELYPELIEPTKKILSDLEWDPFMDLANQS